MTMNRIRTAAVAAAAAAVCVVMAAPASAAPTRDNNPNAGAFTVTCPSGVLSGSAGPGKPLLIEGGGIAVLRGLVATESGEVFLEPNPGIAKRGVLEQCTYVSPFDGVTYTAFVQRVP